MTLLAKAIDDRLVRRLDRGDTLIAVAVIAAAVLIGWAMHDQATRSDPLGWNKAPPRHEPLPRETDPRWSSLAADAAVVAPPADAESHDETSDEPQRANDDDDDD